ncbi:PI-PLC X domain-containing protein At5g67130-like isoform X2 [Rhododendron vialii]|uniref:PI-PLC X domain-containing protein At5g67130-like isoform X2 n=1 Tax=Rhododendron vialii TaxID=182163 RepID=UPI00265ECCC6|nr:PI-PLC X domain-containing protein At5g67130-like isoform X2 [Rhododendron vialii]
MGIGKKSLFLSAVLVCFSVARACSNGECKLLDECTTDGDCETGLYCFSCPLGFTGFRCVRSGFTDQFKLVNDSLPFNKYAFLTTHNAYAIDGEPSHTGVPRVTLTNQEDNVTQQLNNGARALMLDTYDFKGDVWLCHSFGGECYDFTAFEPAIDTLREVEAFLSANPSEIVTIILEDYVQAPNGLTKVFTNAGLMQYWFPLTSMPQNGQDWPLVSDMVAKNQRLLVFTSIRSKQESEGIAYQWNYMVENQYGDGGMEAGNCSNRAESSPLDDKTKSLVLVNYFRSVPIKLSACVQNSEDLIDMLQTCHGASGNRWANFVAVDYYKRSEGGGTFQAVDTLNGELLCGCEDVHSCVPGSTPGACNTPPPT